MKFVVDANLPRFLSEKLAAEGHDVLDARFLKPFPASDLDIYHIACLEERIILTRDLDFSNILLFPPEKTPGIIVLRVFLLPVPEMTKIVTDLLACLTESDIRGKLVIAEAGRFRIHDPRLP